MKNKGKKRLVTMALAAVLASGIYTGTVFAGGKTGIHLFTKDEKISITGNVSVSVNGGTGVSGKVSNGGNKVTFDITDGENTLNEGDQVDITQGD